jgi:GNAT superfamily N-acetyltransferase
MSEIIYTQLTEALAKPVEELIHICFTGDMPEEDQYNERELIELAQLFPEGNYVALAGERVIGIGTGIFTDIDFDDLPPTEYDLLYTDERNNHDPNGSYYFGSDLAVHPEFRGQGIARGLYERRKGAVLKFNKKGFAAAAVLPGYKHHKHAMSAEDYVKQVIAGEVFDPTLSVQIRNGFQVIRPLKDFFEYTPSENWAAIILWENPEYHAG